MKIKEGYKLYGKIALLEVGTKVKTKNHTDSYISLMADKAGEIIKLIPGEEEEWYTAEDDGYMYHESWFDFIFWEKE